MKRILIIGATSAIAEETARVFAARGDRLYLLARNAERLEAIARDLKIRGAESVRSQLMDADRTETHGELIKAVFESENEIDTVLIAYGTLPNQKDCQEDSEAALKAFHTNAVTCISFLTHLANRFEAQRHGTIVVLGSVAGDRGRQSNYVYGAAKGALTVFLQGLRNRLHKSGIRVTTVKLGFVDTPMTQHIKKGLLWAQPGTVARGIVKAIDRGKDEVYLPSFWRLILMVIGNIPEIIFKRLSL